MVINDDINDGQGWANVNEQRPITIDSRRNTLYSVLISLPPLICTVILYMREQLSIQEEDTLSPLLSLLLPLIIAIITIIIVIIVIIIITNIQYLSPPPLPYNIHTVHPRTASIPRRRYSM